MLAQLNSKIMEFVVACIISLVTKTKPHQKAIANNHQTKKRFGAVENYR
jgi:hypothetical protein